MLRKKQAHEVFDLSPHAFTAEIIPNRRLTG
jgi:hypothetical protein